MMDKSVSTFYKINGVQSTTFRPYLPAFKACSAIPIRQVRPIPRLVDYIMRIGGSTIVVFGRLSSRVGWMRARLRNCGI